jgi:hypothetical protein
MNLSKSVENVDKQARLDPFLISRKGIHEHVEQLGCFGPYVDPNAGERW